MKQLLIFCTFICLAYAGNAQQTDRDIWMNPYKNPIQPSRTIQVKFSKNVEFAGFLFFLGHFGEIHENNTEKTVKNIAWKDWYAFGISLYQEYKAQTSNPHLEEAMEFLFQLEGGTMVNLLMQLDDFPNAVIKDDMPVGEYIKFSPMKDPQDARNRADTFVRLLNTLYIALDFDTYFTKYQHLYSAAFTQIQQGLPDPAIIPMMESFYQHSFAGYVLLPSLTIPNGSGFGLRTISKGKTIIYNSFGAFGRQKFDDPQHIDMGFGDQRYLHELSVHEFGHSFVGPSVRKLSKTQVQQTEVLYQEIKEVMSNQAYITWYACLDEHFVRAGEIIIAQKLGQTEAAEDLKNRYIKGRKFIYIPQILEFLHHYDQRDPYQTYEEVVQAAMNKLLDISATK